MSSETPTDVRFCSNCKKDIAAANFTMHEVHCRRHLVLCEHCAEPVPRAEVQQHFNDLHLKVPCTHCTIHIEKDQLDAHQIHSCPRRKVSCEFCELELPHVDLACHLEFCGTRTEACPRCGSFVMHKDLMRHNASNCTYPEAKPPPARPRNARPHGTADQFALHDTPFGDIFRELNHGFNPFEFEEIRRALENEGGRSAPPPASAASGEIQGGSRSRGQGSRRRLGSPALRNNAAPQDAGRRTSTNSTSGDRRHSQQASSHPTSSDIDLDTLLAMQLTAKDTDKQSHVLPDLEPDPDDELNRLMRSVEKTSRPHPVPMETDDGSTPASLPLNTWEQLEAEDEDMIPCEFCGENFPMFALVHHQSVCDPLASILWGPGQEMLSASGRNNESHNPWMPATDRPPVIPVINNLGSASPIQSGVDDVVGQYLTDNGDHLLSSLESIMLPCEFCRELLPADSLVQHQALCEGNSQTPRVRTPAAALPAGEITSAVKFFPTTPTFTPSQQHEDPTESLLAALKQLDEREEGNVRPRKKSNMAVRSTGMRAADAPWLQPPAPSPRPPPPQEDIAVRQPRGGRQTGGRQRQGDSASRTRHTLDSLLSDPGWGEGAASGAAVPAARTRDSQRSGGDNSASTRSSVSSRTVMRSMQQQSRRQPRSEEGAQQGGGDLGSRRPPQQARASHLFNSPGNLRGQNRPRRPSTKPPAEWS